MRIRHLAPIALAVLFAALPLQTFALNYDSADTAALATNDVGFAGAQATTFIGTAIAAVLGILGVIFLVLTIYAGLLWMTAGGNTDNVKKAKAILTNSVIGLIIVLSSYAITTTVIKYVSSNNAN